MNDNVRAPSSKNLQFLQALSKSNLRSFYATINRSSNLDSAFEQIYSNITQSTSINRNGVANFVNSQSSRHKKSNTKNISQNKKNTINVNPIQNIGDTGFSLPQLSSIIKTNYNLATILSNGNNVGNNNIDLNGQKLINVGKATSSDDIPTLSQVKELISSNQQTIGLSELNLNGNSVVNIAPATSNSDAVNLGQVLSLVQSNIVNDLSDVLTKSNNVGFNKINMNDNSIINVADAINPQDVVTLRQIPTLITSSVATYGLNAGNKTIQNIAPAVNLTDAVNLQQTLSLISSQTPSLKSMLTFSNNAGGNQIKNILNATSPQDAVALSQIPSLIASAIGSGNLNLNGNKITNLTNGVGPQDAVTVSQIPALINSAIGSSTLNLNNNRISNVANAVLPQDAVALSQIPLLITSSLANGGSLNLNGNQIKNISNATNPSDAVNLSQVMSITSSRSTLAYVLSNNNNAGTSSINMNNNKILNVANATLPTDAVNLSQLNSAFATSSGLPGVLTNNNSAGSNSINMNNNRILNIAPAIDSNDAVNLAQMYNAIASNQGTEGINMNNNVIQNISNITVSLIDEISPGNGIHFFDDPNNDTNSPTSRKYTSSLQGSGSTNVALPTGKMTLYHFEKIVENSNTVISIINIPLQQHTAYTSTLKAGYYVTNGPNSGASGNISFLDRINYSTVVTRVTMTSNYFSDLKNIFIAVLPTDNGISVSMVGSSVNTLSVSGTIEILTHK